jgi:rubrerythrin
MDTTKNFNSMLLGALEMEEKGYEFYKTQSAKSKNKITKDMFLFLADNELFHIESIKKFHESIKSNKAEAELGLNTEKQGRIKDLDIFLKSVSELNSKISPNDTDKQACEFAMEFEKNGYEYYKKMLLEAKDEQAKGLLEFLLEEEKRHYEILEKTYAYLTDSANWFMYEEGSFPQG